MAISAPTPISALVHSSTLVTSGLFLMMRFSYLLYSIPLVCFSLSVLCIFTTFYAGLRSVFEADIKKLIALSTLRHLGFIGLSFSLGLLKLSFFHLLSHALFKSLLFMCMGDIIINLSHYQDFRYLSSGISSTPFSSLVILVSLFSLLGLPIITGFYSKDLVLESFLFTTRSYFLVLVLLINVGFTFFYTFKLFSFTFSSSKLSSFQTFHSPFKTHSFLLRALGIFSLLFGFVFVSLSFPLLILPLPVPFLHKTFPFVLLFLFLFLIFMFASFFSSKTVSFSFYFSSMSFLTTFVATLLPNMHYKVASPILKSFESGSLNFLLNFHLADFVRSSSRLALARTLYSPLSFTFMLLVFLLFIP
jgi:NADH-ubiquinone oxidoreductase chain 5